MNPTSPAFFVLILFLTFPLGYIAVELVYHRSLSHHSVTLHPVVRYFFVVLALPAGTPIQWVGNHRAHHQNADTPRDVHSPVTHGFWTAQSGWYLGTGNRLLSILYSVGGPFRMLFDAYWRPRTNQQFNYLAQDAARDPLLKFLSHPLPYGFCMAVHAFWFYILGVSLWGTWTVPIIYLAHVFYYFSGDSVNSLLHRYGSQPFATGDNSRNHSWLTFWYIGLGYHNSHHAFPSSANTALMPGQWDALYSLVCFLKILGLARDIKTPGSGLIQKKLRGA